MDVTTLKKSIIRIEDATRQVYELLPELEKLQIDQLQLFHSGESLYLTVASFADWKKVRRAFRGHLVPLGRWQRGSGGQSFFRYEFFGTGLELILSINDVA